MKRTQTEFKPSMIYAMVNNHVIKRDTKQLLYSYKGMQYVYQIYGIKRIQLSPNTIKEQVGLFYGVDIDNLVRKQPHTLARRMFYFLSYRIFKSKSKREKTTSTKTASILNNSHGTCLYHVKNIEGSLDIADKDIINDIKGICDMLNMQLIVKKLS